jgi:hypothetical protein
MKLIIALLAWGAFCIYAFYDAGVPYQCSTDTECELLHGVE